MANKKAKYLGILLGFMLYIFSTYTGDRVMQFFGVLVVVMSLIALYVE